MSGRYSWAEPSPATQDEDAPFAPLAHVAQEHAPLHGMHPSASPTFASPRAPLPEWQPMPQAWTVAVGTPAAATSSGALHTVLPVSAAPMTSAPAPRTSSRRDGLVGITIGLVLLAATFSGSIALNFLGNHPATTAAATPAAVTTPQTTTTTPAATTAVTDPAVDAQGGVVDPAAAGDTATTDPATVGTTPPPAAKVGAKTTVSAKVTAPRTVAKAPATKVSRTVAGGGATAPARHTPASTHRPAAQTTHHAATAHAQQPATTPATTPAPTPAPQPTAAAPSSYSISTPNGASWTSSPGELDAVKAGVPNATITPNA